jgi:endonuclease/exonuclease/phosphatase (EEP) superfamily protein YafD
MLIKLILPVTYSVLTLTFMLTIAGYFGYRRRYFELASHFRLQYLIASLICFLILSTLGACSSAAIAFVCLAINAVEIIPWHLPKRRNAASSHRLKLVLANLNYRSNQYDALIDFVEREQPDIFVAQEVTEQWDQNLRRLRDQLPFVESRPAAGGSGISLYSRHPFTLMPIRIIEGDTRPGILARFDHTATGYVLLTAHPRTPIGSHCFAARNELLLQAADCLNEFAIPKIFVGDLNTTPWSPHYHRFVRSAKLVNVRKGFGLLPSWPTGLWSRLLMIPIDHCLVSNEIAVIRAGTGDHIGSDHLPLVVELIIP